MYLRMTLSRTLAVLAVGVLFAFFGCQEAAPEVKQYEKWQVITLDFEGPNTSETAELNPFTDYRVNVIFSSGSTEYRVPAYYAADGNAAESSADEGSTWRVHFTPDQVGTWTYEVSFEQGSMIAVSKDEGEAVGAHGEKGVFEVIAPTANTHPFQSKGRLIHPKGRFFHFAETGEPFIKGGANSPENLLAYADFDGTYSIDSTKQFIKEYQAHLQDWKAGDPTWQAGKGKGLIGAINYLSEVGMNAVYFLTMNIEGDGRDVFPYRSHTDLTRFDCSKLDQWNIIFAHAQAKGIALHFVTQETENEMLLDDGDTGPIRSLYYRELVARFAHHHAVFWNLGEENGPADFSPIGQNTAQRKAMTNWFKENDPYQNPVLLHTHAAPQLKDSILPDMLGFEPLNGLSVQIGNRYRVHQDILRWWEESKESGHEWVSFMDEIGWYWMGAMPDQDMPTHDTLRQEVLWPTFLAGGSGVEWYFGYKYACGDLNCEDWRTRDKLWKQTKITMDFFSDLPMPEMEPMDELLKGEQAHCLAKVGDTYVVYIKRPSAVYLDLTDGPAEVEVKWMNPMTGEWLSDQNTKLKGGAPIQLDTPTGGQQSDWVALVTKV